jgi:hypothetical protein
MPKVTELLLQTLVARKTDIFQGWKIPGKCFSLVCFSFFVQDTPENQNAVFTTTNKVQNDMYRLFLF